MLGRRVLYKAPYSWLMMLPPFSNGLRVPARFAMLASLCLAVAAGIALARLLRNRTPAVSTAATSVLLAIMMAEVWGSGFPLVKPPEPMQLPILLSRDVAVVELPIGGVAEDTVAIYRSVTHRRRVVNGYSGYDPPHYTLLRLAVRLRDTSALTSIRRRGDLLVAIHKAQDRDDEWEQYVRAMPGSRFLERPGETAFYLLERLGPAASTGAPVRIQRVVSSESAELVDRLRDGRYDTMWATAAAQRGGEHLTIELDGARDVCGVGLAMGRIIAAFPRGLEVSVSGDGKTWTQAWTGTTAGLAVEAALTDPQRVDVHVVVARQGGVRFVRLLQQSAADHEWAIAELTVLGCS
jgi:F5/8 type C domain